MPATKKRTFTIKRTITRSLFRNGSLFHNTAWRTGVPVVCRLAPNRDPGEIGLRPLRSPRKSAREWVSRSGPIGPLHATYFAANSSTFPGFEVGVSLGCRNTPLICEYCDYGAREVAQTSRLSAMRFEGRRFTCSMRVDCGQLEPGAVIRPEPGERPPRMPERLDEEALADRRAGRNAVYQLAALTSRRAPRNY
jgi:hypothetical protein